MSATFRNSMLFVIVVLVLHLLQIALAANAMGIIVVPGLGRLDRIKTVAFNVERLFTSTSSIEWDCVVYVYALRSNTAFWQEGRQGLTRIEKYCKLIENSGKRVTENMYMLQPALLQRSYSYVFLLLDDIMLPKDNQFSLQKMVHIMHCNHLTVLSPMIDGANKGGGQKFRNIMQTSPQPGTLGYVSSFVEIFAWLMTMPAYTALWELLCPEFNPYAWGYDFWYNGYAKQRVVGNKMGIVSSIVFTHEQDVSASGAGRTDNARIEDKWNAVMAQERHYLLYRNISLSNIRKNLDISNTSWNGAVKGYLYDCKQS